MSHRRPEKGVTGGGVTFDVKVKELREKTEKGR
jgi:hypothetical protein